MIGHSPFHKKMVPPHPQMKDVEYRELVESDYNRGFIECVNELVPCDKITEQQFKTRFDLMKNKGDYTILVAIENNRVVGTGTLFLEYKFLRQCVIKGHIEDIVVLKEIQGRGIGKEILRRLTEVSVMKGAYKTALVTKENTVPFYIKCGFTEKEREMVIYHKK